MLRGLSYALRVSAVYCVCIFLQPASLFGQVNVLTQHNDIARTGQNLSETVLAPANVSSGNFGKLFAMKVDGQIYAQPLYLSALSIPGAGTHNVLFVATMHDSVYALDADTGVQLWQVSLLDAAHGAAAGATTDPTADTGCTELDGTEFGITSTPVIDPAAGIIYVVGKTVENGYPVQRLHALSLLTGAEMTNSPVTLQASVAGTGLGSSGGVLSFDPKYENQRAGLLLLNGIVYIGFAGYCDYGTWHGWVMAYNGSSMRQTSVFTPTPNSEGSGIWLSGTGLAADAPAGSPFGRLFLATGNGTYDATTPYGTNTMDYGVDVLRLDLTNGVMKVTDAFTPFDQANLNSNDMDLASGGVLLLPDNPLAGHTHQLLAAGKTGNIYVVDRDSLGGYSTTANNIVEDISPNQVGGVFGSPAYWNGNVYYWGDEDTLKQFSFYSSGLLHPYHLVNSSESAHFPGSTPAISANGTSNGIVWDVDGSAYVGSAYTPGSSILYAHDANNVATTLYSSATNSTRDSAGPAVKMAVPTIANGKVYVGTYGEVDVYGLLNADFALSASPISVSVSEGSTATDTITVNPIAGFTGSVSLSASGLPSGLTAAFASGTSGGTTNVTFAAASSTASGSYPVVITGTSGSLSHTVTVNVTVTTAAVPSFSLSAAPASLSVVQGQSVTSNISVIPANGFNSSVSLSASGVPAGVNATFGSASNGISILTLATTAGATPGNYTIAILGSSSSVTASTTLPLSISPAASSGGQTQVNLSSSANVYGIYSNGTSPANGGLDSAGYAYSSNLIGNSVTAAGATFSLGGANTANAMSSATIALPAGSFSTLNLLATGVFGSQTNQMFVVTYSDGTTSSFTQSLSDWGNGQGFAGEAVASTTAYRVTPGGGTGTGPWHAYAYAFALNAAKTLRNLSLPSNRDVVVLAVTLTGSASQQASQSISFPAIQTQAAGSTVALAATASSGLPVSFVSSTPSVCTVSGSTASLLSGGTCTITASQSGNTSYAAATPITQSFSVVASKGTFTLSASATSVTVTPPICYFFCYGGANATDRVTVTPANGFTGTVTFSISGLPAGVTAAFNPSSLSTSGATTLTLTPASTAARSGKTTLTIYGTAGTGAAAISTSTTVTLNY